MCEWVTVKEAKPNPKKLPTEKKRNLITWSVPTSLYYVLILEICKRIILHIYYILGMKISVWRNTKKKKQ